MLNQHLHHVHIAVLASAGPLPTRALLVYVGICGINKKSSAHNHQQPSYTYHPKVIELTHNY